MAEQNRTTIVLKTAWDLLRGSARYRFCALMVRLGTGLVLGPPLLTLVVTRLMDAQLGANKVADGVTIAAFVVGVGMIIFGTLYFLKQSPEPRLPDGAAYRLGEGETFESFAQFLAERRCKALRYEGFTEAELKRLLTPGEISGPDVLALMKGLGSKTQDPSRFPRYEVIEGETDITIRTTQ